MYDIHQPAMPMPGTPAMPAMPMPGMPMPHYSIYPLPFMPYCVRMAHAYVPYQCFTNSFPINEALQKGTYFPELYQPYNPEKKLGGVTDNE